MTNAEQIERDVKVLLNSVTPSDLNEMLDTAVELDSRHTLTVRELIAQSMISISRNPFASKDCRARALRVAKRYLKDSEKETE